MSDDYIHTEDPGFEDFVKRELDGLALRADEHGICLDCLTDRVIVEMVASLTRAGISARDILSMVLDGIDLAQFPLDEDEGDGPARRMH
ncbi:hypothetical protein [Boseongicola aestuarii]|uniref:Uncharacterized protein n=1 Tax=Boseongicola aestuarii TaxID=1470561 RepID=A0A238IZY9_9RHOB|nr:hypothetical protein [Boseongicola aestuarii]SMX24038.1 hypothetical protein BOA8489_02153 [Boseongicola aestuarii]